MRFDPSHADSLRQLLEWRRDIRHFRSEPVPEGVLDRLRDSMDTAPSVGNARPWRVLRVETKGLRDAVRAEFERCRTAASTIYDGPRLAKYNRLKLAGLDRAPVHLAVFTETDPAEGAGLGRQTMPETLMQSTAMAIHTLWLAARAENVGLGMVSILEPLELERLFAVPESWCFTAYLCLGYPEAHDDRPLLDRAGWQPNVPTRWESV
ncbi:5,6-dimethylbenzimidazole synthase [Roseospira navarrensis]|uniref:5,6-dimethylbenzimidazole synthase n=2 Tax=Roseospira navarrensis TaxID=140058 RepID=A0A7X2D3S5_9PROT|nr:5,6-dimethylbenzimidazole synthase [Roseospira navarrensis]MQX37133.1 5,6-dimethylbenzimidazole synthase [Roseospira navarrensis]